MIKKICHNTMKLIALLSMLSLTACMTTQQRYFNDYHRAQQSFAIQNYRDAFIQLQAPAKAGNPDAQYALGYLYYTGKGTLINEKYAKYLFEQAASQGQAKAKQALSEMEHLNSKQGTHSPTPE